MITYTPTRIEPLALAKFSANHWQYVDTTDNRRAQVGPIYRTKTEALADLENYAIRGGWVKNI
jgi:hypothetical protein